MLKHIVEISRKSLLHPVAAITDITYSGSSIFITSLTTDCVCFLLHFCPILIGQFQTASVITAIQLLNTD